MSTLGLTVLGQAVTLLWYMKLLSGMFLSIVLFGSVSLLWSQCRSNPLNIGRWPYMGLYYTYSGSLPATAVAAGALEWNSPNQNFTTISLGTFYDDLHITDNNGIGPNLGELEYFHMSSGNPCYLKRSSCSFNFCFGVGKLWYANMRLSNNNIGGAANDWAPVWGTSFTQAVSIITKAAVSHEIGHFFGLGEISTVNCSNRTIMSVLDIFYCFTPSPTACDSSQVASKYSGWATAPNHCYQCLPNTSCTN